jgi:hypothetical protein
MSQEHPLKYFPIRYSSIRRYTAVVLPAHAHKHTHTNEPLIRRRINSKVKGSVFRDITISSASKIGLFVATSVRTSNPKSSRFLINFLFRKTLRSYPEVPKSLFLLSWTTQILSPQQQNSNAATPSPPTPPSWCSCRVTTSPHKPPPATKASDHVFSPPQTTAPTSGFIHSTGFQHVITWGRGDKCEWT